MPPSAVRSTTSRLVFHAGTPSASEASRSERGTRRTISSVARASVGIIRMASATAPASAEKWPHRDHHQAVGDDADHDRRARPPSTSAVKRTVLPERAVAALGEEDAGADAERQADERRPGPP